MAPRVSDRTDGFTPPIPQESRLSLDPALRRLGALDGAWWPRSRNASVELPTLVSSLNAQVGAVLRLGVDARDWDDIPRRVVIGGRPVRVGWFADVNHKIIVTCGSQDHLLLLVVPPRASTAAANSALAMASIGKHGNTPEEILIAAGLQNDEKADRAEESGSQPVGRGENGGGKAMSITSEFEAAGEPPPRLLLRPAHTPRTGLDGGWWPRSADPSVELAGLIGALQGSGPPGDHGPVVHVMLEASGWNGRPRRLRVGGADGRTDARIVRLSWFEDLPADRLTAIHADGHRLDLITVPPDTDENTAWATMERATRTPGALASGPATSGTGTEAAQESDWESEGGQVRRRTAAT